MATAQKQTFTDLMKDTFKKQNAYNPGDTRLPVRVRPNHRYYHRLAYAAAGATLFTFFNAAESRFVTNLPQPNSLQRDYWFKVYGIGMRVVAGMDLTGAANATPNNESAHTVAAAIPAAGTGLNGAQVIAEQMLRIYRSGRVRFSIGDSTYLDRMGLDSLPWGGGPSLAGNIAIDNNTTAAATNYYSAAILPVNNGDPLVMNQLRFRTPLVIPPLLSFSLIAEFQTAIALAGGGVIEAYLEGDLITSRANQ